MHLQENKYLPRPPPPPLHHMTYHMTYAATKFEVATTNGIGDTFTRNVTDVGPTLVQNQYMVPFFLKKKAGKISTHILSVLKTV